VKFTLNKTKKQFRLLLFFVVN